MQPFEGFAAFNIKGETIGIETFLDVIRDQSAELGIGSFAKLAIKEGAPPNLFICDLNHEKIHAAIKGLHLTTIGEGVRKSLVEFITMAKKGTLEYSKPAS